MTHGPYDAAGFPVAVSDRARERAVAALSTAYANDRLSLEELDARLAYVFRVQTSAELAGLLADPDAPGLSFGDVQQVQITNEHVPERGLMMAAMGGFSLKGSYVVPRHLKLWAVAGGGELDLRQARFGPGVTRIDVAAWMGGVDLILPEGVRVEFVSSAFLGGVDHDAGRMIADTDAPIVRVDGTAVMGGVSVSHGAADRKSERKYVEAVARADEWRRVR
ncbi:MAG: DUF1707 and DUF2154 domain-containing protein [Gemmatimonadaceae bacterium]|nr:DUF1707 and DUF2154 domain-containing protein [Gemmatimonadaceae bacterium]